MAEPKGKPPHAGKRLTRADVLRLIEEHAGPEGLDLREADLHEAHLREANLQGASLLGANLQEASLLGANLQGADLRWANFQKANLWAANLQEANLWAVNLQGARLAGTSLRDANLEGANWGDYVLGQEAARAFDAAASVYRTLKQWHTEAGMYDVAGEFHYREMEARRKLAQKERRVPDALAMYALRFLYGYGERPLRVVVAAAAVILGFALVHCLPGVLTGGFWSALYYSAVSFTALGYGGWAPEPQGWAGRFLGAGESFMGVFMIALFLVTFTRKMTR